MIYTLPEGKGEATMDRYTLIVAMTVIGLAVLAGSAVSAII